MWHHFLPVHHHHNQKCPAGGRPIQRSLPGASAEVSRGGRRLTGLRRVQGEMDCCRGDALACPYHFLFLSVLCCVQVHQYRVAMTAKDCSIMVALVPSADDEHDEDQDMWVVTFRALSHCASLMLSCLVLKMTYKLSKCYHTQRYPVSLTPKSRTFILPTCTPKTLLQYYWNAFIGTTEMLSYLLTRTSYWNSKITKTQNLFSEWNTHTTIFFHSHTHYSTEILSYIHALLSTGNL